MNILEQYEELKKQRDELAERNLQLSVLLNKSKAETAKELLTEIGNEAPIATGNVPIKKFYWFQKICKKYGVVIE